MEIKKLIELSEIELLELLPDYDPRYNQLILSPKSKKKIGETIFMELNSSLKNKICIEWDYCSKKDNPDLQDTINLISTIGDIISSLVGVLPPFVLATLLTKKGLSKFCSCKPNLTQNDIK